MSRSARGGCAKAGKVVTAVGKPQELKVASHQVELRQATLFALATLCVAAVLYGSVYNRETTLSYSIGYNLYAAERILAGEAPYRDFHTLYPPASLYLNAFLFNNFGVTLHTALAGVLVFKVLTILVIYFCARQAMPATWAFTAAMFGILWLRPNGPFKAVPMHYGALFLALGLYFLLRHLQRAGRTSLFLTGLSLGLLALIKHNIGIYAMGGSGVLLMLERDQGRRRGSNCAILVIGFAAPVIPVLIAMEQKNALRPMAQTLLFGPGEFLLSRLAAVLSPAAPAALVALLAAGVYFGRRFRGSDIATSLIWIATLAAVCAAPIVSQSALDGLVFYCPILVLACGFLSVLPSRFSMRAGPTGSLVTAAFGVYGAAAFLETFPRFAREQAIAAMPFVGLLLFYLLFIFKEAVEEGLGGGVGPRIALATAPLLFLVIASRLLMTTYFEAPFKLRSDTPLSIERGRGVFFPKEIAAETDEVVGYVRARVPEGDYFFAHSYAGSSFLFLANRRNPSGAQFWGGVGVTAGEQATTVETLDRRHVNLIITSDRDLAAETYAPMRNYIAQHFEPGRRIGKVLILERAEGR